MIHLLIETKLRLDWLGDALNLLSPVEPTTVALLPWIVLRLRLHLHDLVHHFISLPAHISILCQFLIQLRSLLVPCVRHADRLLLRSRYHVQRRRPSLDIIRVLGDAALAITFVGALAAAWVIQSEIIGL